MMYSGMDGWVEYVARGRWGIERLSCGWEWLSVTEEGRRRLEERVQKAGRGEPYENYRTPP